MDATPPIQMGRFEHPQVVRVKVTQGHRVLLLARVRLFVKVELAELGFQLGRLLRLS